MKIIARAPAGWLLMIAATSLPARGEPPVDIGLKKQLMVDDYAVASYEGARRVLGKPAKANGGRPIFTEGRFYGTVLFDEGKFKLWHRLHDHSGYGYAESIDGLSFTSQARVEGIEFGGDLNLAVELDSHATNPAHKFLAGFDAVGMAAGVARSADGIRWTPLNQGRPVTHRAADTYNQALWDDLAGTYRLLTRTDYGLGGGPHAGSAARDFEVRGARMMTNPDLDAQPTAWDLASEWHFERDGPREYLRRQIYAMTLWIYEGVYFGLASVYEFPGDSSEGTITDPQARHERDVMNFYLAVSRNARDWDWSWAYAGEPLVPRGPDGAFDKDMILPASTIVTHDGRHWLYYMGANERHGTSDAKPPVKFERQHAIGLATVRQDGLIGIAAGDQPATIITKPFVVRGPLVELNVDAGQGEVQVEILDAAGSPLTEYAGENAPRARGIDDRQWHPRWRNHSDLKALLGQTIRLRFRLTAGTLYAFQILPASTGD